jgi:hypothetical protein
MAYIYKITNIINNKMYIGKTERDPEKRFLEHKRDCAKRKCEVRPLYRAMNKYGVDNFSFEILAETAIPEEDEVKFIAEYDTYRNGYNATLGGDGRKYINIDLDELKTKYLESISNTVKALAEYYGHDVSTIANLLKGEGIEIRSGSKTQQVSVRQIDKNTGDVLKIFDSVADAAKELGMVNGAHISKCARGKRKTAGGYCWEYIL